MAASKCFMFMYFLLPHWVPATWRSRAQTSIRAEFPSGNVPTTRVRHIRTCVVTDIQKGDLDVVDDLVATIQKMMK